MCEIFAIIGVFSVLTNVAVGYVVYQLIVSEKEELKYLRDELKKTLGKKP